MSATENKVPANPAKVEFPRDKWGSTAALRKIGLTVAGKIRGDEHKLTVFLQTLGILAQHAQARCAQDKAAREKYLASLAPAVEPEDTEEENPETDPENPAAS